MFSWARIEHRDVLRQCEDLRNKAKKVLNDIDEEYIEYDAVDAFREENNKIVAEIESHIEESHNLTHSLEVSNWENNTQQTQRYQRIHTKISKTNTRIFKQRLDIPDIVRNAPPPKGDIRALGYSTVTKQHREENEASCPVCMMHFELGVTARQCVQCNKLFCPKCMKRWFRLKSNCPNCRREYEYPQMPTGLLN